MRQGIDAASSEAASAAHILVLDGDDGFLERTCASLEAAGYRVSSADLPDIGLVRRVEPDAIVVGLFFRGQPAGLEFLEHHAADPATAAVPVVVHAAAADMDSDQWRRLTTLAHPVLDRTGGPEGGAMALLDQLRTTLTSTAARFRQ